MPSSHRAITAAKTSVATPSIHHQTDAIACAEGPSGCSIDCGPSQALAAAANITSIPTLMAVRDGVVLYAEPGALPAAALEDLIGQVNALDMNDVRRRVAEQQASEASED